MSAKNHSGDVKLNIFLFQKGEMNFKTPIDR